MNGVYEMGSSVLQPKFVSYLVRLFSVIPAKAGIQRYLKFLDSGSPPAFAGVARNDDLPV
jgi:hypothetical protein